LAAESRNVPRGRFAPSPTGELHLGHASTALLAWLSVRARGGQFVLRLEDLDRARVRPSFYDRILDDLAWLGLDWDEAPDRGGPHAPYVQSLRLASYRSAFDRLRSEGRLYPCFCSRADVAAAAGAPQAPGDEAHYPGTCRNLDTDDVRRRLASGGRHAWRFRVDGRAPRFVDRVRGPWGGSEPGDFVVWRSDEVPAYQLAVVVDDAAMRIGEVVRGDDLLASTPRQLLLYEALAAEPPVFGHVPLLLGTDRVRLSKRHGGVTLAELKRGGLSAASIVGRLAERLGLRPVAEPTAPGALADGFALECLRPAPEGIVLDPKELH